MLVPLAMPLMAGPGAITTVLTLSSRIATWREMAMLLIAVGVVGAATLVVLVSAHRVGRVIGHRGQRRRLTPQMTRSGRRSRSE